MSAKLSFMTREHHLDHMVKVAPFIVTGYLLQCYVIIHLKLAGFATDSLIFLGFCLGGMIAGLIFYDLKHKVEFCETKMVIDWFGKKEIFYSDIILTDVSDEQQSFATLTLVCQNGKKYTFYFVDEADKIKAWLKEKKYPQSNLAA